MRPKSQGQPVTAKAAGTASSQTCPQRPSIPICDGRGWRWGGDHPKMELRSQSLTAGCRKGQGGCPTVAHLGDASQWLFPLVHLDMHASAACPGGSSGGSASARALVLRISSLFSAADNGSGRTDNNGMTRRGPEPLNGARSFMGLVWFEELPIRSPWA